jgi:hypothetical protein
LTHPPYRLSCACDSVNISVNAELKEVEKCDCPFCASSGFLRWKVPKAAMKVLSGTDDLSTYTWRQSAIINHFCRKCGLTMFRIVQANDDVSVNARCVGELDLTSLKVVAVQGEETLH